MEKLKATLEFDGDELVVDSEWANTGTMYAKRGDSLDPVGMVVRYSFQDGHADFRDANAHTGLAVTYWRHSGIGNTDLGTTSLDVLVFRLACLLAGDGDWTDADIREALDLGDAEVAAS
jgi:hypothetical protein